MPTWLVQGEPSTISEDGRLLTGGQALSLSQALANTRASMILAAILQALLSSSRVVLLAHEGAPFDSLDLLDDRPVRAWAVWAEGDELEGRDIVELWSGRFLRAGELGLAIEDRIARGDDPRRASDDVGDARMTLEEEWWITFVEGRNPPGSSVARLARSTEMARSEVVLMSQGIVLLEG